jgi:hypothetical protein
VGAFYVNIVLRGPEQEVVAALLQEARRAAYVSPTVNGRTVLYDEECDTQDEAVIRKLAAHLSERLRCAAWAVLVHDDDVLWYVLYDRGRLADEYSSAPHHVEPSASAKPMGGDAKTLCEAVGHPSAETRVRQVLAASGSEDEGYVFETDRHRDLANALGLRADWLAGMGYADAEALEDLFGYDGGKLMRAG